jgi:hypothetical protein
VNSRSANSRLRRPQPSSTARIARSRLPLSGIGRLAEPAGFLCGEPISQPYAQLFDTLHAPNAGGKFRAE